MTAKIKIRQYVIFIELRKFDTVDVKCFTVISVFFHQFYKAEQHDVALKMGSTHPGRANSFLEEVILLRRETKREKIVEVLHVNVYLGPVVQN